MPVGIVVSFVLTLSEIGPEVDFGSVVDFVAAEVVLLVGTVDTKVGDAFSLVKVTTLVESVWGELRVPVGIVLAIVWTLPDTTTAVDIGATVVCVSAELVLITDAVDAMVGDVFPLVKVTTLVVSVWGGL